MKLKVSVARVFRPLLKPARYKGAYGGRGAAKSHFFAEQLVVQSVAKPGLRAVCIREIQKSLKESAKRLIEDKIDGLGVAVLFDIQNDQIKTPGGGVIIFQGMQDHTAESIKSLEGFDVAWVEEAQTLSTRSLNLLRPTIRKEDSELWFSWNPTRKSDPVDKMLRQGEPPTNSVVVKSNWSDNPWLPNVLEQERADCYQSQPEQYDHIWEGGYISVAEGAYFASALIKAKKEGRIGNVAVDPLLATRIFVDIGGTGAKADAFVIWVAQFVGTEIRLLDYYEVVGQPLEAHLTWLRSNGYGPDKAQIWLPHDGRTNDRVYNVSYESALRDSGYDVTVVPNQGKGAAAARIEAGRRLFPSMWFNKPSVQHGLEALGWYHEKKDEKRNIGLGPDHDWSSHCADAFGLLCVVYELPKQTAKKINFSNWG